MQRIESIQTNFCVHKSDIENRMGREFQNFAVIGMKKRDLANIGNVRETSVKRSQSF
jgi:hypothetical protein